MKLSTKGEYATRALLHLALQHRRGGLITTDEIASQENIPRKYLEQILTTLKQGGLVRSRPGIGGGYHLARPPEQISLGEVVRLMDGPLAPISCVSRTAHQHCPVEGNCGLRSVWEEVRNAVTQVLDKLTFADVVQRTSEVAPNWMI